MHELLFLDNVDNVGNGLQSMLVYMKPWRIVQKLQTLKPMRLNLLENCLCLILIDRRCILVPIFINPIHNTNQQLRKIVQVLLVTLLLCLQCRMSA